MSAPALFCCQTPLDFVISVFVCALLAVVQKGNHAQSPCTQTVIVVLGYCNTVEAGGVFFFVLFFVTEQWGLCILLNCTGMITNRFAATVKVSFRACCSTH